MRLTVWGARGSVPVSSYASVHYGGDTTCLQVETREGDTIIFDLGTGVRALGNQLVNSANPDKDLHILLTHAHWDHLMGFPFFKPLYLEDFTFHFHGWSQAQDSVRSLLQQTMKPPFFPVDLHSVAATLDFNEDDTNEFDVAGLHVQRFPLSHPNGGWGYRLSEGSHSVAFFPDNEFTHPHPDNKGLKDFAKFCDGVDLLIHDAMYLRSEYEQTTKGWGHTVVEDAAKLAHAARAKHLLLWHHEPDRSDAAVDSIVSDVQAELARLNATTTTEAARTGQIFEF